MTQTTPNSPRSEATRDTAWRTPADGACGPTPPSRRTLLQRAAAGLVGALNLPLLGCGGGAGDDGTAGTHTSTVAPAEAAATDGVKFALGGIDGGGTGDIASAFISAAIDSTAPLTVNGITIDTDGSTLTDGDGEPLLLQQLQPGMSCQIEARILRAGNDPAAGSAGAAVRALRLRSVEQLTGPVQQLDAAAGVLVVWGQRVVVNAQTVWGGTLAADGAAGIAQRLAAVQLGAFLRIWGQLDVAGARVVATRIDSAASASAYSLRGALTVLDRASGQLAIGAWTTTAAPGVPLADGLSVGTVVRVRLALDGRAVLSVSDDALTLPDRVQAEVEGRVTRVDTAQRFALDGIAVDAAGAQWLPATSLLRPGQSVAVRGRWNNGRLQASRVTVQAEELTELQGVITAANGLQRSFVLKGLTVVWGSSTRFEGGSARQLTPKRRVAVLGRRSADGLRLEAVHIHLET